MDEHKHCQVSAGHEMDGHKHCQKCLQVMGWMNTLSKVPAGHEMAGQTQSIVISNSTVMRWINTNTVIVSNESAGDEMDEHKHCQMCLQVMRWMDTLSKVQVMRWMDTNTVKCLQVMRWTDKCVCKS